MRHSDTLENLIIEITIVFDTELDLQPLESFVRKATSPKTLTMKVAYCCTYFLDHLS